MSQWAGFKPLKVEKIVEENEWIKSFYLVSDDELPTYTAGQFLPIKVEIDGTPQMRRYTLSGNPMDTRAYRLTIKREPDGVVSNYMHDHIHVGDTIEAMPPFGKFVLEKGEAPVVLLSGGIGMTPMLSMLYQAVADKRDIYVVNVLRDSSHYALRDEFDALQQKHPYHRYTIYSQPKEGDDKDATVAMTGRITYEWLSHHLPLDADYYFCGPVGFMKTIKESLVKMGISDEHIHYEFFGQKAF